MKQFFILLLLCISLSLMAQDIELPKPKKEGGMPLMQAFTERMTNRVYQSTELSLEELSQLVWVANGINRPDGKRTIPTARNRQEVEILVLLSSGSYLYNPQKHILIQKNKRRFTILCWCFFSSCIFCTCLRYSKMWHRTTFHFFCTFRYRICKLCDLFSMCFFRFRNVCYWNDKRPSKNS